MSVTHPRKQPRSTTGQPWGSRRAITPLVSLRQTARRSESDLVVGSGADATPGKLLTVNYTGWIYDPLKADRKGLQFETSLGSTPFSFQLGAGQVIAGWDQGIAGMKVGGTRRLVIPSSLAYGGTRNGSIPPYSTLLFEIQLLDAQ